MALLSLAASAAWVCDAPTAAAAATAAASAALLGAALCRCPGKSSSTAPSTPRRAQAVYSGASDNVENGAAGLTSALDATATEKAFANALHPAQSSTGSIVKAEGRVAAVVADGREEAMEANMDAIAAASEVAAHVASMRQTPELLTIKVRIALDGAGSLPLRSQWVALHGDLLWILQMRTSDFAGKNASAIDLPRLAEQTVHIQGAKLLSKLTKSGGQISLSGIKSPGVQCLRLQVDGKEPAQKLEIALRDAVGRHQLPEALGQALVRATSAPPQRPRRTPQQTAPDIEADVRMEVAPLKARESSVAGVSFVPSTIVPPLSGMPGHSGASPRQGTRSLTPQGSSPRSSLDGWARPLTPRSTLAATAPLLGGAYRQTADPLMSFGNWASTAQLPMGSRGLSPRNRFGTAGSAVSPRFSTASSISRASGGSAASGRSQNFRAPYASHSPYLAQQLTTAELQVKQLTELWQQRDPQMQARRGVVAAAAATSMKSLSRSPSRPASVVGSPGAASASPASQGAAASAAAAAAAAASAARLAAAAAATAEAEAQELTPERLQARAIAEAYRALALLETLRSSASLPFHP